MPLTLQALRDEIAKNKAFLDTLEDTGKEIIADSSEDPQVVRDVRGELNKIVSPVEAILRKLAERQVKLQNALLRSQEFQVQTDVRLQNLCSVLVLHAFLYLKFHLNFMIKKVGVTVLIFELLALKAKAKGLFNRLYCCYGSLSCY